MTPTDTNITIMDTENILGRTEVFKEGTTVNPPVDDQISIDRQTRDIAEVPAAELITSVGVHLMSAAAVKCGLAENGEDLRDLDEARKLITALAGLVTSAAPEIGGHHAAPLRDGLQALQLAFREASNIPDGPGQGPGENLTGVAAVRP